MFLTFTSCAISGKTLFTSTAVRTVIVGTNSILVTGIGICGTLIDICHYTSSKYVKRELQFVQQGDVIKVLCEQTREWQMTYVIFWIMFNIIWFREFCGWLSYLEYE